MGWIIEKLNSMRQRPNMYVGDSVTNLKSYLDGYSDALTDNDITDDGDYELIKGFEYWLAVKAKAKETINWAQIIENHFASNDHDSITTFYTLWDKYIEVVKTKSVADLKKEYLNFLHPGSADQLNNNW